MGFFWKISGGDINIIETCDEEIRKKFSLIGLIVSVIFFISFLSFYYTLLNLFNNYILCIPIGLLFSWIISNIYLIILTTLQKNLLPHISSPKSAFFSFILRIVFLVIISILVSKPIERFIFSKGVNTSVLNLKENDLKRFKKETIKYYDAEISKYSKRIIELENMKALKNDFENDISDYKSHILELEEKKNSTISKMEIIVNESPYFIQSIKILSSNKQFWYCWFISVLNVILFLLPVFLKYYISETSSYYGRKVSIEKNMILKDYSNTKVLYSDLLFKYTGNLISIKEKYQDPPFNTILIKDERELKSEKDFLGMFYSGE